MLAWDASTPSTTAATPGSGGAVGFSPAAADGALQRFAYEPAFVASQRELRTLLISTAQSEAPTRRVSPAAGDDGDDDTARGRGRGARARQAERIETVVAEGRRLEYLKNYVARVAPWLDMFDARRAFGIQIPAKARTSPPLLHAILALSARHLEQLEGKQGSYESLELYQEAIRLLTPLLQTRDPDAIAVCVILCVLEMMSASGEDWRKHLEGCAALFDSFGVHGFDGGLLQAVFWCYARMDLCGALMSDGTQSTLIEPSKWLPPGAHAEDSRQLFHDSKSPDMYANYAVYLCARVCELLAERTKYVELGESNGCTDDVFARGWEQLWVDLQRWLDDRPKELLPIQQVESKPFPRILFVHWAAISSNQLHHTACILLLNMVPRSMKPSDDMDLIMGYAKRICGISLANPHEGCINNAIQPLWIAGRFFSHRSEHTEIVRLLRSIETSTGWATSWRLADLERTWGYKIRYPRGPWPAQPVS